MNKQIFQAPRRQPIAPPLRAWTGTAVAACLALVSACGGVAEPGSEPGNGSGNGSGSGSAGPALPTSGTYSWVLKPQGTTASPRFGLSLLHPQAATVERVIEPASAALTDVKPVLAGSYDVAGLRITALRTPLLLYIANGDVRSVPLAADGTLPRDRILRAASTSACRFQVDANDHTQPLNSRWTVSTAGPDGGCDSADDGWAEITVSAQGQPRFAAGSGEAPMGMTRDTATLVPRGWILPRTVLFWARGGAGSSAVTVATRNSVEAAFTAVVLSTPRAALADDGSRLTVLDFRADASLALRPLDAAVTAGGGWRGIGFDANAFYVFRNSTATTASAWRVLRVARSDGAATVLASGEGQLSNASMGTSLLYITVLGTQNNRLLSITKAGTAAPLTMETTALSTFSNITASAGSVHQLFRVSNLGSAAPLYAIEFIDETGARLFSSTAGGYPMALADASALSLNTSESRTRFVFATGYGARGYADATLVSYGSASRAAINLGTLPGTADFGQSTVFASVSIGPDSFAGGFAGRVTGTTVDTTGSRIFSFDIGTTGSLKLASPPP